MYQGGDSFSSLGCNKDERYNGESTYITIIISIGIITITVNIITLGSSGEWKPGSYVAVVTFVTLALALVIGTAYDIFIRVVYIQTRQLQSLLYSCLNCLRFGDRSLLRDPFSKELISFLSFSQMKVKKWNLINS